MTNSNKINSKRISLGVIKFKHNNIDYIHCPIRKIKKNNNIIKIGVCKNFKSLKNTKNTQNFFKKK